MLLLVEVLLAQELEVDGAEWEVAVEVLQAAQLVRRGVGALAGHAGLEPLVDAEFLLEGVASELALGHI